MRWRAGTLLLATFATRGEIVDRIAVSVGNHVITESEVIEEIRVTAFLDGTPVALGADQKRNSAERLIDQSLMQKEIAFTRFSSPSESEVQPLYAQVRGRFPDDAAYEAELKKYGLTDAQIRQHLARQLMMLRFIEYRFQPGVQVNEGDIEREYRDFAEKWRASKKSDPPPLEQVRDDVEKLVRQRLVDSALDRWLGEVRTQNSIIYRKGYEP
jgi:hypothetical protein